MAIGKTNAGGGSGNALNFNVKRYATEAKLLADTPKENTIGIISTTEMTGWIIDAKQPDNLTEGMVWILAGTDSSVEFNALKKNGIQVYPLSAKQYVSGTLVDKTTKIYQGGEWVDWFVYLFSYGDECTDISGGWALKKWYAEYGQAASFQKTDSSLRVYCDASTSTSGMVYSKKKVNLRNKTKLVATVDVTYNFVHMSIVVLNGGTEPTEIVSMQEFTTSGTHELAIDLDGEYFIGIRFDNGYVDKKQSLVDIQEVKAG